LKVGYCLLLDLGIEVEKIKLKFLSLLSYKPIIKDVADYDDMTGPIIVFILFGIFLMLVSDVNLLRKGRCTLAIFTALDFQVALEFTPLSTS